ncbi:MAG: hypothetical protein ACTHMY_05830 [Solirubrobacteraceae bacterium]
MFDDVKGPGIAGALAVASGLVVKDVLDVFRGPLLASILIIVGLALFSALVNRLLTVISRRRDARALLRVSPDMTSKTADPYELGVFPVRSGVKCDADGLPLYVERDIDQSLRAALVEPNAVVVIVGPPLAGKSRTAFETVRRVSPDAPLLYPRTADALRSLAESDLARRQDGSVVLWLDDLSRYQSALDAQTWHRLIRAWPGMRCVVTLRADDYQTLVSAGGDLAESGRFLLSEATRFQLDIHWTSDELARAADRHPALAVSHSHLVPQAFAIDWNDLSGSTATRHAVDDPRSRSRYWFSRYRPSFRPDLLCAVLFGLLAAVTCLGLFLWQVTHTFRPAPPPPTIADQLHGIRGSHIFANDDVQKWSTNLQDPDQPSYIFYSHSKSFGRMVGSGDPPPTDTLRVYDEYGTHIARSFVFAPTYLSGDPRLTGDAEFFERRSLTDLVGAGAPQLVGVYSAADQSGSPALPVIMYWDETAKGYVVNALMQQRPSLAAVPHPSRAALAYRAAYTSLSALETHMSVGPQYIVGYPVQDLAIVDGRNGPRIVLGYVAQTIGSPPRVSRLEVQAWSIGQDQATGDPTLQTRCVLRGDVSRRFFVTPLPGLSYPTLLREFWEQFDPQALC